MFTYHRPINDSRINLIIVGGFLGSGKTTLLNLASQHPNTKLIINDLGDVAPDLENIKGDIELLLGGCACCDKLDELIHKLRNICSEHHKNPDSFNHIILEMSGIADPANVLSAINSDPVLTTNVRISEAIVTLDAVRGIGDLIHEPLARKQLQQCDKVVITKVDMATDQQLETTLATTLSINPGAEVIAASFGQEQMLPDLNPDAAVKINMDNELENTNPLESLWIPFTNKIDWTAFAIWFGSIIYAHQHDILRVKGLLRTAQGLVIVHAARGVIGVPTIFADDSIEDNKFGLLFLTRNLSKEQLLDSWNTHIQAID